MDDELMDLVNKSDEVIGEINRSDYAKLVKDNLGYIRAADMFIVNSDGKVFVPTRTADKTIAPNGYDYSVGGHVAKGETYLSSIIREAREELYLNIDEEYIELIDKTVHEEINYITCLYVYRSDETPKINPSDFIKAEWMTPDELIQAIENGHPAKGNLRGSAEILKSYLEL